MRPLSKSGGIWQQSAEYIRLNKKIIAKSNGGRKIATIELIPDLLNGGYLMFNIQWIVISNSVFSLGLRHRFFDDRMLFIGFYIKIYFYSRLA